MSCTRRIGHPSKTAVAWSALVIALAMASPGCTVGAGRTSDGGVTPEGGVYVPRDCDPNVDSDADGIADGAEDATDWDMDGTPNDHDLDSDGDGVLDADEHGPYGPCLAASSDRDAAPDFLDTDSDNDGVSDGDEVAAGTSRTSADSDGDGFTDLAELAAGTRANDPNDGIPAEDFFVILPYMGEHVVRPLDFGTDIHVADVYFLVDATGSMGNAIHNLSTSLSDVAQRLASSVPDLQMGVGYVEDFPFHDGPVPLPMHPYFGGDGDEPYHHLVDITGDVPSVQSALGSLAVPDGSGGYTAIGNGGDGNESQVEGLYQTATGAGGSWTFDINGRTFDLAPRRCPQAPDDPQPRRGYPCFRPGSLPIVVMITDIEFHNGGDAGTQYPYTHIAPNPHGLPDAVGALYDLGARYVGIPIRDESGMYFHGDHDRMALGTGSVDASNQPLVFPADLGLVSDSVVDAISELALHTPMDVSCEAEDRQPNPDAFDATQFIKRLTAIEGFGPGAGQGYDHHDDEIFYRVVPGTSLRFEVDFFNDVRPPAATAQIFRATIYVLGNRSARLDARNVYIIVPPDRFELVF